MWMPAAIQYGIDLNTFFRLNPRIMFMYQEARENEACEKVQMMEANAFINGIYQVRAISNALFGRKSPYPEKILGIVGNKNPKVVEHEMTEAEKIEAQKKVLAGLMIMQSNFETSKK